MQVSAVNNSISFKGIIPVKVFCDGAMVTDPKHITSACRKLTRILVGPPKTESDLQIMRAVAKHDGDYDFYKGQLGEYLREFGAQVSDFFRCFTVRNCGFIATGKDAEKLGRLGYSIGYTKKASREFLINNFIEDIDSALKNSGLSFEVKVAKRTYNDCLKKFAYSRNFWITEGLTRNKEKVGEPVVMSLYMKSNGKLGKTTFKDFVDSVAFEIAKPRKKQISNSL